MVLIFPTRGRRRRASYGLCYISACGRYEVYKSDQVDGVKVAPPRWKAISLKPFPRVIGDHRTRQAAEAACNGDAMNRTRPTPLANE